MERKRIVIIEYPDFLVTSQIEELKKDFATLEEDYHVIFIGRSIHELNFIFN